MRWTLLRALRVRTFALFWLSAFLCLLVLSCLDLMHPSHRFSLWDARKYQLPPPLCLSSGVQSAQDGAKMLQSGAKMPQDGAKMAVPAPLWGLMFDDIAYFLFMFACACVSCVFSHLDAPLTHILIVRVYAGTIKTATSH